MESVSGWKGFSVLRVLAGRLAERVVDGEVRTPFNCPAEGIFTCGLTLAARLPPMGLTPVATGMTFLPATLGLTLLGTRLFTVPFPFGSVVPAGIAVAEALFSTYSVYIPCSLLVKGMVGHIFSTTFTLIAAVGSSTTGADDNVSAAGELIAALSLVIEVAAGIMSTISKLISAVVFNMDEGDLSIIKQSSSLIIVLLAATVAAEFGVFKDFRRLIFSASSRSPCAN